MSNKKPTDLYRTVLRTESEHVIEELGGMEKRSQLPEFPDSCGRSSGGTEQRRKEKEILTYTENKFFKCLIQALSLQMKKVHQIPRKKTKQSVRTNQNTHTHLCTDTCRMPGQRERQEASKQEWKKQKSSKKQTSGKSDVRRQKSNVFY